VTAGAVIGPNWAVVIDTLALPDETLEIRDFIEQEFAGAGALCDQHPLPRRPHLGKLLLSRRDGDRPHPVPGIHGHRGRKSLEEACRQSAAYRQVRLILPHVTFSEDDEPESSGKKTMSLILCPAPATTISAYWLEEDRVLFAGMYSCRCPISWMAISMT
jgi:hypothetical protein